MKGSFTDGFLFYRIASFMDFTYSATYGTRDIAFFFYQIYHRADIGRDLTPDAGATLIHGVTPCALRDTCISPATNVCPTSQSTRLKIYPAFGCALSGPFGSLHLDPVLSLPDSLCAHNCFDLRFNGFGVFEFSSIYYAWCKMLNIFLGQN